jgi:uncharacterized protein YkwD
MDPRLRNVAISHTQDMARFGYYYSHPHIGSDGSSLSQRMRRAGFRHWKAIAENISSGFTVGNAFDNLFLSPQHRVSLMSRFKRVGVGVARWNTHWIVTIDQVR